MNKSKLKQKAFLLGLMAQISALSLSGCGNEKNNSYKCALSSFKVEYDANNQVSGTIKYEDIEKSLWIVTLEQNGITKNFLMIKDIKGEYINLSNYYYIDVESGTLILQYQQDPLKPENKRKVIIGENIEILKEEKLFDYLFLMDELKREYDINELINFYHEKVEPLLSPENEEQYTK